MNYLILKTARRFNIWLYVKLKKAQLKEKSDGLLANPGFHSLSPIKDANVGAYVKALQWGLDNSVEKEIYNIALTGPYGSGKSTILKTFQEKNENKKYVFLNISLATFKEEEPDDNEKKQNEEPGNGDLENGSPDTETPSLKSSVNKSQADILRLIELSILQQIFYHEEDDKIPDSRFKKIKSFNRKSLYYITAFLFTAVAFGTYLFFPKNVGAILLVDIGRTPALVLHWLSLTVFFMASIVVVFRSVRLLYSLRISKLKFKEAEIEIDKNISKSILNNHLDEILYFFEVTPYSVVLIEDLDRFRQAEIFTKLRELNQLINNSKKIKNKKVVFIYAVRDEMFQNKDRTKFFDFIIPVIPIINSSNSKEKLSDLNTIEKHGISAEVIDDTSLFIDDMRLLYNITNEFMVYSALLDKGLPRDNLFAMLVYKNIYPEDFVALGNNKGKLYNLLQKRAEYIKEQVSRIEVQIQNNKKRLDELKFTMLKDTDDLRILYVAKFVDKTSGFSHFIFAGEEYSLWEAATAEGFEFFKKGNFKYYVHGSSGSWYALNQGTANFRFENFEAEVDKNQSYLERLKDIEDVINDVAERLKKENQTLEKQKTDIRQIKLKDIFSINKNLPLVETKTPQGQLLSLLLRSGYIGEDYLDYISLFYEGSLTKSDYTFFINVKSQAESEYDFALVKIANVITKIRPVEFSKRYLLNYNLVDFMLVNEGYEEQLNNLLGQLKDANEYGISFMDGFMNVGTNTAVFINRLLHIWPGLWKFVEEHSSFTKERIEEYFVSLIENAAVGDLLAATHSSRLEKKISEREDFLTLSPDIEKLARIIKTLEIKFTSVLLADAPQQLVDLVVNGIHYALNDTMLRRVMLTGTNFDLPTYEESNYQAVLNSGISTLVDNVNMKIDHYIEKIYLPLAGNVKEPEAVLVKLLNSEEIELKNRRSIIARSEIVLAKLSEIENNELDEQIFTSRKILVNWNNVLDYFYRHESIDETLVNFLNDAEISHKLAAVKIKTQRPHIDLATTESFMHHLVCEGRLSTDNFKLLVKCSSNDYDVEEISGISREQLEILINESQIKPKPANFDALKADYLGLHSSFLDVFVDDVMENLSSYPLDGNDIAYILHSEAFELPNKLKVIKSVNENIITESKAVLVQLRQLMFQKHPLPITKAMKIAVLDQYAPLNERIQLFNMYYQAFEGNDAQAVFKNFPSPYSKIGVRHTSFVIPDEPELQFLANNLDEIHMIANHKPDKKGIKIINYKWN
jgi:chaperonin cofactor prefoldin